MLYNSGNKLYDSHILQQKVTAARMLFIEGGGYSGNFFELRRQMRHTAVMQLPGNFCEGEIITPDQFFNPFDPLHNNKLFNCSPHSFRKYIREVGIIEI